MPWRRKWQPTPVSLPGKSHGQKSLVGYRQWSCKESDTTERLHFLSFFLSVENIPSYNPDHFLFCTFMRKNREKLSNLETVQWTFGDTYFQGLYYKARALYLIFHFMFHSRYPDSSSFSMTFFSSVTHLKGMMSSKWFCLSHTHSISP